ncbi:MAG TPA: hypothetical protein VFT56_11500 [Sphingomonas sp.]|nr:hypothetical protein [Sphingomonas sp.]
MEIEFEDTEPCCCGSGIAYFECCKSERVKCLKDANGRSSRFLIANEKTRELMSQIEEDFRESFGRKYGPRDLLFTGGWLYSKSESRREFEKTAKSAGIPGHLLYAYRQTDGLMLTEENYELATPDDRAAWEMAVTEYLEAKEFGIDLNEPQTGSDVAIKNLPSFLSNLAIHLGSYCHRAPIVSRRNQALFFQFLLLSQCHSALKIIMDRFEDAGDNEIFALLRRIYECSILIGSLTADPSYSASLLAHALAGTEHYPYRQKKNGDIDYGKIVEVKSGDLFDSRVSFSQRAKSISFDDYALFEIVYPDLSSGVHFDSGVALRAFMTNGQYLNLDQMSLTGQFIRILIVSDYLLTKFLCIPELTNILERDANFIKQKLRRYLYSSYSFFDDDDLEVDANASLFMFAFMNDYRINNDNE